MAFLSRLRRIAPLSIFAKILLGFVLAIAPLYLLSFFLYQSGINMVRARLLEIEAQQSRMGLQNIEREVQRVEAMVLHTSDDYALRKLALESTIKMDWDNVTAIQNLQRSLFLLSGTSPLVDGCRVWLPAPGRTITPWEVSAAGSDAPPVPEGLALVDEGGGFSLNLPYPVNYRKAGLQFMICTSFTAPRLREYLRSIVRFAGGSACLLVGTGDSPIFDSASPSIDARAVLASLSTGAKSAEGQSRLRIGGRMQVITVRSSASLPLRLVLVTPEERILGPLSSLDLWFAIITAFTVVLLLVFVAWITTSIERPLHALIEGLKRVEQGDLKVNLTTRRRDEFGFLYDHFDSMVASLDGTMSRLVEKETLLRHAELKQLQYQINPHFLYNSIYHMYRMARAEDYECIVDYALHLGAYFEFITRSGDGTTSLGEEAVHAKNYMEIQRIRFGGRILPIYGQPSPRSSGASVPRLILQPLLENAYNHGLAESASGGEVRLDFEEAEGAVGISIEDSGGGLSDARLEELREKLRNADLGGGVATGLVNIHRRLTLQFGPASALRLDRSAMGGLRVSFSIPFEV